MLTTIRLYREYRRQGLRRAWSLSGMSKVAWSSVRVLLLAAMLCVGVIGLTRQAEAIHEAADNRVAAKLSNQAGEIGELRKLLAACLGEKEGALWIGGELHLCRAVPTGIHL